MLKIHNLSISFQRPRGFFSFERISPVRSLNLQLRKGELMAVVGESGAGKSLMLHALLGLLPKNARVKGEILYRGAPLTTARIRQLRGKEIAFIPQNLGFLNPLIPVGKQVARAARLSGKSRKAAGLARDAVFRQYNLESRVKDLYPFQISGGMARRILCAAAVAGEPRLILADEPTTGLDAENTALSLDLLKDLSRQGCSILLITHDLKAALDIADTVSIFKEGCCVETAGVGRFKTPAALNHPYSKNLYNALPQNQFISAVADL
ncbi:ATP-binding cassette domain-containing protein [Desulfospira joergensenii]|uniref:ATP-binding cassette domain-containing protein n=1 Tax=Desulfospira joergensenii TaxID=53329 RepID=UPI0003B40697|nr:ATP-binding cassette domain-containing protein [Desulfospira joergensenii]